MTDPGPPPFGDTLLRTIGAAAAAGLRSDAGFLDPLITRGLVDVRFAGSDPATSPDPVGLIRDLGSALGDAFEQDPSLVGRLGFDAVDLLRKDAIGPSGRMARGRRSERTLAVATIEPVDRSIPVAAVAGSHGGSLVRRLGGAHLISFGAPAEAIHALLDVFDASEGLRAGAETGEVTAAGGDLFGPVVATACRMAAAADPGEVLVTPNLRDPLGEIRGVSFGFVPPREDGAGDPIAAWSVRRS